MSASNYDRNRDLECLRLAADFMELAADTLNPHLKKHCVRMAKLWSREAEKKPSEDAWGNHTGVQSALVH